jgi:hypothetical protein
MFVAMVTGFVAGQLHISSIFPRVTRFMGLAALNVVFCCYRDTW